MDKAKGEDSPSPKSVSPPKPASPPKSDIVEEISYEDDFVEDDVVEELLSSDTETKEETKAATAGLEAATKDKAYAYATWAVGGLVVLLGLVLAGVAYARTVAARASFESHMAELAKLRRLRRSRHGATGN